MRAWHQCCVIVDKRDNYMCRVCRCRTVKSLTRSVTRAEHHHLIPRSLLSALRADPRVCILVCARCHDLLTHHRLRVVGAPEQTFVVNGRVCMNANGPLMFIGP
jgi:hypothetical protein